MDGFPTEIIFLLVAGLISLINWLIERAAKVRKAAAKAQKQRETASGVDLSRLEAPRPEPAPEPERETVRATLPLPDSPLTPRLPVKKSRQPEPAPKPTATTPQRRRRRPPRRPVRQAARRAPSARSPLPAAAAGPARTGASPSWANLLRTRDGLKAAFVMREVLGTPRAYRGPLDRG